MITAPASSCAPAPASSSSPPPSASPGDRIGLVGRNGAGKTTLTKVLAGEGQPAAGTVTRTGEVGYLPQDPRTGDLDVLARDRILSARGLDTLVRKMRETEDAMASGDGATRDKAMRSYARLETRVPHRGRVRRRGRGRHHRRRLGLADRVLGQPLRPSPAVSAAASSWPASCSPAPTPCCSTSRPTTSTPTRSSGCATT